jgi:antitoxin PrlF
MKARAKKRKRMRQQTSGISTSRLTSKYQATIPIEIREHLHLKKGDQVVYELLPDNSVVVRKILPLDIQYLKSLNSTLTEWKSDDDEQAYKNLSES